MGTGLGGHWCTILKSRSLVTCPIHAYCMWYSLRNKYSWLYSFVSFYLIIFSGTAKDFLSLYTVLSPNIVNTLNFACRYYAFLCSHENVDKYLLGNGKENKEDINFYVTMQLGAFVFRSQHQNWQSIQHLYTRGWFGQCDCLGNDLHSGYGTEAEGPQLEWWQETGQRQTNTCRFFIYSQYFKHLVDSQNYCIFWN